MNSLNSKGGGDRAPSRISLDPSGGLIGQIRARAPWQDLLGTMAVRAAKLPTNTGLIGGQYAQYMAEHLPAAFRAIGDRMLGPTHDTLAASQVSRAARASSPRPPTVNDLATADFIAGPAPAKAPPARPTLTPGERHLLDAFAHAEGTNDEMARRYKYASGYDVLGGYRRSDRPLTSMTLEEVMALQKLKGGPMGRYQAMHGTLGDFRKAYGLNGREAFDAALQDQFGAYRLRHRGYGDPKLTPEQLQLNMSKEWASIEQPGTDHSYYKMKRNGVEVWQPVKFRSPEFQAALVRARELDAQRR